MLSFVELALLLICGNTQVSLQVLNTESAQRVARDSLKTYVLLLGLAVDDEKVNGLCLFRLELAIAVYRAKDISLRCDIVCAFPVETQQCQIRASNSK